MPVKKYINSKTAFIISLIVFGITILSVWLLGLGKHRSLYQNSILSVSILSFCCFLFLFVNLYRGVKLKDTLGNMKPEIKNQFDTLSNANITGADLPEPLSWFDDGCGGIVMSILIWIIVGVVSAIAVYFIAVIFWLNIIIFSAMLYWIFFRALRFVLKHRKTCEGNVLKSLSYSFFYTLLYNFWIFGILLGSHYLTRTN